MATKIEVLTPIESILESNENEDVKVKRMLTALYYIVKNHQRPSVEPPIPTHKTPVEEETKSRKFNYELLPPNVNFKKVRRVISALPKHLVWNKKGEIIHNKEPIPKSNISELVLYLSGHTREKPSWLRKLSKFLHIGRLRQNRKPKKQLLWESYKSPPRNASSSEEFFTEEE